MEYRLHLRHSVPHYYYTNSYSRLRAASSRRIRGYHDAFAGRLVYVGITQEPVSFPHAPIMHRRELTLVASRNALAPDFTRIIKLIEDGRIDTRPWITHQAGFDDMIGEFPNWLKPETGVIKAIVAVA